MPLVTAEGIYVSAKAGALVSRMASVPSGRPVWIGCRRVDGKLVWDEDEVLLIPADEYRGHRRTYDRHLRNGELVLRTEADFHARELERAKASAADAQPASAAGSEGADDNAKAKKKGKE